MKNQIKKAIYLTMGIAMLSSCSKDEEVVTPPSTDLNALQPVKYDAVADKTTASVKTGNLVFNPATNTNQFEYLTTIDKQTTLTPLSVVSISNIDVIYPGSILRGSSFINKVYDPLVLSNPFNDVVLSGTLRGVNLNITASCAPKLSSVRNSINNLMDNNKGQFNSNSVPSVFEYESVDIINKKSFSASMDVHAEASLLGDLVASGSLNYSAAIGASSTKKYTMVKMRQWLYNFAIDPKFYGDWINGPIQIAQCGTHEPLYISSVDYGRVAYILIESSDSKESLELMISTAAKGGITGVFTAGAEQNLKAKFDQMLSQNKIKFMIVGGPASLGQQITDFNSFSNFVKNPTTADLVSSSVPISYKVRRLKDNTQVEVKDIYAAQITELKAN